MKILDVNQSLHAFLQFLTLKKRQISEWQFLHLKITKPDEKLSVDEIVQFLEFQIQSPNAIVLKIPETHEFILLTHRSDSLILTKFEKALYENFSGSNVLCSINGFDRNGMGLLCRILEPHIQDNDVAGRIAIKRISREANCLLVLDDDIMVIKQLEKALSSFGNVITIQDADEFEETYRQYAPNVLFLDVHLRKARGNELLKSLKKDLDPQAHVVMISSDTNQNLIMDIKEGGANGFVVKPFDRNKLYKEVMKAPTIITKAS